MIKQTLRNAFFNWSWLLGFELLHKFFGTALLIPLFQRLLAAAFGLEAFYLIDRDLLAQIQRHPTAIVVCLLWAFCFALFFYAELAAILLCCDAARRHARPAPLRMALLALRRTGALLHVRNLPLLLGLMLGLPCGVLWLGMLCWVGIPLALPGLVRSIGWLGLLCVFCTIGGLLCVPRMLLGLPDMLLDDADCATAWRRGGRLLRTHLRKRAPALLGLAGIFVGGLLLCFVAGVLLTLLLVRRYGGGESLFQIWYLFWTTPAAALTLRIGLLLLLCAALSLNRPTPTCAHVPTIGRGRRSLWLLTACLLLVLSSSELLYPLPGGGIRVVAHRGGALFAPENSRSALRHSQKNGADEAEIDVQQTRDGQLILLHDYNLRRTTGLDWDVWETDYTAIRALKLDEPVLTLEQAIAEFPDLHLMIELKRTGRERYDTVAQTLALIHKYDALDRCSIGSMELSLLEQAKAREPRIDTVYITPLLYADQFDLDYLDAYSLESSLLTPELTERLRADGKRVYVWTVNSGRELRRAIYCAPDGIITDNTYLAQYHLTHGHKNHLLGWLSDLFYPPVTNLPNES